MSVIKSSGSITVKIFGYDFERQEINLSVPAGSVIEFHKCASADREVAAALKKMSTKSKPHKSRQIISNSIDTALLPPRQTEFTNEQKMTVSERDRIIKELDDDIDAYYAKVPIIDDLRAGQPRNPAISPDLATS